MRWLGSSFARHLIRPLARPPPERPSVFQTYIGEPLLCERGFDLGLKNTEWLGACGRRLPAVYEYCRSSVNARLNTVFIILCDFIFVLPLLHAFLKHYLIESEFTRKSDIIHGSLRELGLTGIESIMIRPEFHLFVRALGRLCSRTRRGMNIFKGEIPIDDLNLSGFYIRIKDFLSRLVMELLAKRALEIAEFNERNRRVRIPKNRVVVRKILRNKTPIGIRQSAFCSISAFGALIRGKRVHNRSCDNKARDDNCGGYKIDIFALFVILNRRRRGNIHIFHIYKIKN